MKPNNKIELEVCSNVEWLRNNCLGVIDNDADDAARELGFRVFAMLVGAGYSVENAKGQRVLFHGWNGAHFTWRCGPVGTFEDLTAKQKDEIEGIVAAVENGVRVDFAEELEN